MCVGSHSKTSRSAQYFQYSRTIDFGPRLNSNLVVRLCCYLFKGASESVKKETLVKLSPPLHVFVGGVMVFIFFGFGDLISLMYIFEKFASWRLYSTWMFVLMYSFWFGFRYLSLNWRIWLGTVPADVMESRKPLLEWVSVSVVFSALALIFNGLTYSFGFSSAVSYTHLTLPTKA